MGVTRNLRPVAWRQESHRSTRKRWQDRHCARPAIFFAKKKKKRDHILPQQYMVSLNNWSFRRPPTSAPSTCTVFCRIISRCLTAVMHGRTICVYAIRRGRRIDKVPVHQGLSVIRPLRLLGVTSPVKWFPIRGLTKNGAGRARCFPTPRRCGFLSAFAYVCPWIPQTLFGLRDIPKQTRHTASPSWLRSSRRHTNYAQRHTHQPLRGLCLTENHPRTYTSRKPLR